MGEKVKEQFFTPVHPFTYEICYNTFAFYLVYFSTKEKICLVGQNTLLSLLIVATTRW